METVTVYKAIDGSVFQTGAECKRYEQLLRGLKAIEDNLKPTPLDSDSEFNNGGSYVQQSKERYPHIQTAFLNLASTYIEGDYQDYITHAHGCSIGQAGNVILGRILSDLHITGLDRLWARLGRIDSEGREWGQLYFTRNPNPAAIEI